MSSHDAAAVLEPTDSAMAGTAGITTVCARENDTHAVMSTARMRYG